VPAGEQDRAAQGKSARHEEHGLKSNAKRGKGIAWVALLAVTLFLLLSGLAA